MMPRKYANPPIIEALCEIQFDPGSPWDLTVPGLVYKEVGQDFPKRRLTKQVRVGLRSSAEGIEQELQTSDRMQFARDDETALIQVGENLLAVNHLRPYPSWEGFRPLIQRAYQAYREVAKPTGIQRIGLQYINRVEPPGPTIALEQYFSFYPFLGPGLPKVHGRFIVGVDIQYDDDRNGLRLQLSSAKAQVPETLAVLLGLDYSLRQPGALGLDEVHSWLETAHGRVEETFEGCITDALRAMFEEVKPR